MGRRKEPPPDPFYSIALGDGSSLWRALRDHDIPLTITSDHPECEPEDRQHKTLVHAAVDHRQVSMVRNLVRMGAPADLPDAHGVTPLMLAVEIGSEEILEVLLEEGVPVDGRGRGGQTALMWTHRAWYGGLPTVPADLAKRLLAAGADIAARDDRGRTALSWAVTREDRGAEELVSALLVAGADPHVKDLDGLSAIETAELHAVAAESSLACLRARSCLERIQEFLDSGGNAGSLQK